MPQIAGYTLRCSKPQEHIPLQLTLLPNIPGSGHEVSLSVGVTASQPYCEIRKHPLPHLQLMFLLLWDNSSSRQQKLTRDLQIMPWFSE